MMNEHSFVAAIHNKLKGKAIHKWKINARFANGVPDAWYSGTSGDVWVEYKWGKYDVSALQQKWLTDRQAEGRRCWLVIGSDDGIQVITAPPYAKHKPSLLYSINEYVKLLTDVCASPTGKEPENENDAERDLR
jgi:hypothetical protein